MIIIGLCGNSGSGKGTVCKSFLRFGIPSIDADALYRELTASGADLNVTLSEYFGKEILNDDGSLNRSVLSKIVFSDETGELLKKLNRITHSRIIDETENRIKNFKINGERAVIFDAPLLFESGFDKKCDIIITVIANAEDKIKRIMQRDDIDFSRASARINSQLEEKYLVERSNYVIKNVGDVNDIDLQVEKIIKNIFNCEV